MKTFGLFLKRLFGRDVSLFECPRCRFSFVLHVPAFKRKVAKECGSCGMKFAFAWIGDRWDVRTEPPVVWIAGQAGNLQTPKAASEYKDQMENGEAGKAMTFEEIERLTGGQQ